MTGRDMTRAVALALWIGGFAIGTVTHALELGAGGWMPYRFAPDGFNLFWTMLVFVAPLVIGLCGAGKAICNYVTSTRSPIYPRGGATRLAVEKARLTRLGSPPYDRVLHDPHFPPRRHGACLFPPGDPLR